MITIENIKHFIAIVDYNGVNKAAARIFISASSLTRSVQIIETSVNKKLFDRVGKNVIINEDGKKFYQESLKLINSYEGLINFNDDSGSELTGNFTIGASHYLCTKFLSDIIFKINEKYKHANFSILSLDTSLLIKKIHAGEIDMGIAFSPKESFAIESETLFTGELVLCGRKGHPLSNKNFSQLKKEINKYPATIHRPHDSVDRCDNHPMFIEHSIVPTIQTYWDSDLFAVELLNKTDCWTMIPDIVVDADPRISKFHHPKNWSAPYEVKLIWNKNKPLANLKEAILQSR